MRVLVVDDEPVARRRLRRMLGRIAEVEVVGEAADGVEALAKIEELSPDVLLLDIRMPGLDGLSLALARRGLPPVIFTTAHAEYAVDAFAAEAMDYLLKPIDQGRLEEALRRVGKRRATDPAKLRALLERLMCGDEEPRLTARSRGSAYFFEAREIPRIHSDRKYAGFDYQDKTYLLDESIGSLEERLTPWGFFRIHRSELVNLRFVRALHRTDRGAEVELLDGQRVPVGRRRAAELANRLGDGVKR
jgi:DNA-binding LytR/AlgR family response regulator